MKSSNLLRKLGGSVIPDSVDNPVLIPPTLQPTVEWPSTLAGVGGALGPGVIAGDTTFFQSTIFLLASQSAGSATLFTFSEGLWRVDYWLLLRADFNGTPQSGSGILQLNWNVGVSVIDIASVWATANVTDRQRGSFVVNIPNHNTVLSHTSPATAAAQTLSQKVAVLLSRLG